MVTRIKLAAANAPPVEISKDTTAIDGPRTEDGFVDYLAALNRLGTEGVTPENNAAVLLVEAIGPQSAPQEHRSQFFQQIGVTPPPIQGEYFISLKDFALKAAVPPQQGDVDLSDWLRQDQAREEKNSQRFKDASDQLATVLQELWSMEECPTLAQWLSANETPLQLAQEAANRSEFYLPLMSKEMGVVEASSGDAIYQLPEIARALTARAMLRLKQERFEEAWRDILAVHRWSRLVGRRPFLVDILGAVRLNDMAAQANIALAYYGDGNAEQIEQMLEDLQRLPTLPDVAEKVGVGSRFEYLDAVVYVARRVDQEMLEESKSNPWGFLMTRADRHALIDWNAIMRSGNRWHNLLEEAARQPTYQTQLAALREVEVAWKQHVGEEPDGAFESFIALAASPRNAVTKTLDRRLASLFFPSCESAIVARHRAQAWFRMTQIALTLAAHRADHGEYPNQLDELAPTSREHSRNDPFTDEPLRYQRAEEGYLLWSVGPNLRDQVNLHPDSPPSDPRRPDGDDIIIQMPARR